MPSSDMFMFIVFIVYGATFLVMAAVLWLGVRHTTRLGIASQLPVLAFFALTHGASDLVDAVLRTPYVDASPLGPVAAIRLVLLAISFIFLLVFGILMLIEDERLRRNIFALGVLAVIGAASGLAALFAQETDAASIQQVERAIRLLFGLPGGLLSAAGLYRVHRRCACIGVRQCGTGALVAAGGMAAYAIMAGALATGYPTPLFILGLPIQLHRMAAAVVLTIGCVMMIRSLELEPGTAARRDQPPSVRL